MVGPNQVVIGQAAELFCAAKEAEGLSPRSIAWYRMILDRLIGRFGPDRPVDLLAAAELRAWLVELRATLAPVSIAGYVRGLRAVGNWLAADGLAEARGFRSLARPRVPHRVMEPLSDGDLRRLVAAADLRDRAILLLLLDTGLRASEVAGIGLADLRADGSIKVMGKGAKERIVPVGGSARRAIGRYLDRRGDVGRDGPLFLGQSGERLTLTGIQQLLLRLRARAGVRARCNPHTFRHTFAHNYLVNGGDVFTLQRILGHTSLEMVRRYVALADADVANRHRSASPADRLLSPRAVDSSTVRSAVRGWSAATRRQAADAQLSRSTGDALRWTERRSSSRTNTTDADHTVKSDSGSELASSTVAQNATFNHTFNAVGTFTYRCTIHTYMKGTIEVLAAGAALPSTDTVAPAASSAAHPSPFVLAAPPMFATALVIEFHISRRRA